MAEKVCGVCGIELLEDDGCSCHGCSCLGGKIRTWVASVYLVSTSRRCHVFWPHPAGMVRVSISDLEGTDHSDPVTHSSKTTLEHDHQKREICSNCCCKILELPQHQDHPGQKQEACRKPEKISARNTNNKDLKNSFLQYIHTSPKSTLGAVCALMK